MRNPAVKSSFTVKPRTSRSYQSNQGYRVVGGRKIYFRSSWEVNYAIFLEFLKKNNQIREWHYEPRTFWFESIKRGTRSYLPDFQIMRENGTHYWIEVKGYMDAKSATKIKRFKKYYPEEEIHIVQKKWFTEHREKFPFLCQQWETAYTEGLKD